MYNHDRQGESAPIVSCMEQLSPTFQHAGGVYNYASAETFLA